MKRKRPFLLLIVSMTMMMMMMMATRSDNKMPVRFSIFIRLIFKKIDYDRAPIVPLSRICVKEKISRNKTNGFDITHGKTTFPYIIEAP